MQLVWLVIIVVEEMLVLLATVIIIEPTSYLCRRGDEKNLNTLKPVVAFAKFIGKGCGNCCGWISINQTGVGVFLKFLCPFLTLFGYISHCNNTTRGISINYLYS